MIGDFFVKIYRTLRHFAAIIIKSIIYFSNPKKVMSPKVSDKRTLYIDVTGTHFGEDKNGISRVVKKFCEILGQTNVNYELVYTKAFKGFLSCDDDRLIQFSPDDVYLCLYLTLDTIYNKRHLTNMQRNGVKIYFMLYDLIPLHFPAFYSHGFVSRFRKYVINMLSYTGIITDSKAILDELLQYMQTTPIENINPDLKLEYVWLGSDFSRNKNMAKHEQDKVQEFLMVSTVEPRKKYDQALSAFELLWKKGMDVKLRIVGRPGWKDLKLFKTLNKHPELNKKLFWYKSGISDKELSDLYNKCDAVIFASLAEGYGLAVVEAASCGKPLILRDIPVFREIAGDSAYYFSGLEGKDLAEAVEAFIECKSAGNTKLPTVQSNSWEAFTKKILDIILCCS
ncbi:MAG: glycosyltransferase family 4 protein [Treponema sp.]|nr:glycosyltransferase family 4 protein [Treponema sp.]